MTADQPVVFVVDDDPSVRRAMRRLLRAEGFPVETFCSGPEFLLAVGCREGCAVLDVRMPACSGFDILDSLAARGSRLPVILITGHGDITMAMRARRAGCVSFLSKPVEAEALVHAIREALGRPNP